MEEYAYKIRAKEKKLARAAKAKAELEKYDPNADPEITGDHHKTLFVSRLPKETTEADLRKVFSAYGSISRVRIVRTPAGLTRRYAFILFDRERDMEASKRDAASVRVLGERVCVDVERGRTVRNWKPRRLGGGLGGRIKKLSAAAVAYGGGRMPPVVMGGRPAFDRGPGAFRGGFNDRGPPPPRFGPPRGGYGGDRPDFGHGHGQGGFNGPPRGGFNGGGGGGFNAHSAPRGPAVSGDRGFKRDFDGPNGYEDNKRPRY